MIVYPEKSVRRNPATDAPLQIGIVVEQRYLSQEQPAGLIAAMRARNHLITVVNPQTEAYKMPDDEEWTQFQLILARGRSPALISLMLWAEHGGVQTINRGTAIQAVLNKAAMSAVLASARIPMPRTYLGPLDYLARKIPPSRYPLIFKPIFGDNCKGLKVVHDPVQVSKLMWPETVALAQEFVAGDGFDLKLYAIGNRLWAVRKPSPFQAGRWMTAGGSHNRTEQPERMRLTPELRKLGRRCGALFGLELFGVDCVVTPDGPVVIEVNDFPNYTAVPHASDQLAEYAVNRTRREIEKWQKSA